MMKALWNGKVIAESDATEEVEGNHYFPPNSIQHEYLSPSGTTTVCPWKGTAHYYTLKVDGEENPDAVWYYPDPKEAAIRIKDYIAFWRGVEVV
ncbi:MAG: nucleotidyltransferase domain-containing protein [Prosthecochloris sp.]|nr:nucleotidyltransferase domain-containing protein [Prosthecochloris sp.]